MLATVALGGLRSGEVRGLRAMDLDLDRARILVRQAVEYGKDGESYRVGIKSPKTSAGVRSLPMSTTLVGILRDYLKLHPKAPEELVFTVRGDRPMGPAEADRRHNCALANIGLRTPEAELATSRRDGEAVTVASNDEAARLNDRIRDERIHAGVVDDTTTATGSDGLSIGRGDLIQTRKNRTDLGVANRQQWIVQHVEQTVRSGCATRTATASASTRSICPASMCASTSTSPMPRPLTAYRA
ncbi:site-specific integrase [Tessaracoccus sp.]|uniref:hypothetical protein n=1 Tax=Tessaracoccus sp. TaxID=1971211 RepID=UPI00261EA407|nr:hypothetical protein [Tessaracoccus sp.]